MRRVCALVGVMVLALGALGTIAHAEPVEGLRGGEVRGLSVVPAAGRAEVVIAVGGAVDIQDFSLAGPPRIVIDMKGAKLTAAPRMYDHVTRGGITNVRVAQYRENVVRVVIDLDADHQYTVTRGDGEVRVKVDGDSRASFAPWRTAQDVAAAFQGADAGDAVTADDTEPATGDSRPLRLDSKEKALKTSSSQARITVTYQDADIRDVIAAFAVFSGRTIVVGKGVKGSVSAEVRDQPWDVALRAILQSQGLAAKEDQDGIISVDSWQNIAAQQATEPLTTRIISVNYARASSLIPTIKSLLSKECPLAGPDGTPSSTGCKVRGDVTSDSATNRLIVTDVASRLDDISNYVKDLDVRTPQVAIKAKIILVNRTNIEDMGVSYDLGDRGTFFNKLVQRPDPSTFKPVDIDGDGVPDGVSGTPFDRNTQMINLGGNSLAAVANATQRVTNPALQLIFSTALGKFDLTAFLDALQEVRLADVQAEPSIVTLDNRKAELLSGEETPIRIVDLGSLSQGGTQATAPRATVQFKETGIILSVTPHITNNRKILMTLHSERSQLQPAASDLGYTFLKQRADNELLVGDGETAVIGGLTVTQVQQDKVGIPLLVDLPLVGKLFGETKTQEDKSDLLILVTPHIIDDGERIGPPGDDR
ncbi:MAG TPA: AMIN domain-containing protein [Gemmatimonadaceae bacterium]|nr:AMIN domain-containing protein [Gemmatimonadaceae bacterium]